MPPNCLETLLPEAPRQNVEKTVSLASIHTVDEEPSCRCDHVSYGIGDAVFTSFVVCPLVVSTWRGTWGLMDLNSDIFPYVQIYILGLILHISFAVLRSHLLSRAANPPDQRASKFKWLRERILSRVYTYVFVIANIMHWRGGWGLFDGAVAALVPAKDPHKPVVIAAFILMFYLIMISLRSTRNFLASPYFLVTDGKEPTYIFATRFRITSNSRETILYILDCIFSVGVIGSLVVFVWRGSWALLDIFVFPEDQVKSFWSSLIVGYALVIITFGLQAPVRWVAARLHGAPRLLLADVYYLVSFFATVNVWRGVWGLLDVYFFPETPKLSNWCSHVISLSLLILLNCSNSLLVRGVYIDAEEPAGECVVFPCHYLRIYFHKERTKKRHKQALAAAANASRKSEDASVPLQSPEEKV